MDNSVSMDCGEGNWIKLHQDHTDVRLLITGSLSYLTNVSFHFLQARLLY